MKPLRYSFRDAAEIALLSDIQKSFDEAPEEAASKVALFLDCAGIITHDMPTLKKDSKIIAKYCGVEAANDIAFFKVDHVGLSKECAATWMRFEEGVSDIEGSPPSGGGLGGFDPDTLERLAVIDKKLREEYKPAKQSLGKRILSGVYNFLMS